MADDNLDPQAPVDPPVEDLSLDLDLEGGEAPAPAQEPSEPESPAILKERLRLAELRAEDAERRAREAAQVPVPQPRSGVDPEYEKEEQQLAQYRASGATAEQISWLEWKIGNDRKLRTIQRNSEQATQSAADIADKASFDRIGLKEPKRFEHFAPKVEEIVQQFRRAGQQPPPREIIYDNLVGKAVREGTLKAGPKAAPVTVPRGKPAPGPGRTDVNPKDRSGMTEHQKRIERMKAAHARGEYL